MNIIYYNNVNKLTKEIKDNVIIIHSEQCLLW